MSPFFYIVLIPFSILIIVFNNFRKKRIRSRNFSSYYSLEEKGITASWKLFILPAALFLLSFINGFEVGIFVFGLLNLLAALLDIFNSKKPNYKSLLISETRLIINNWWVKEFDLKELEQIRFLPFSDSFKFLFTNGKAMIISRAHYDKVLLSEFIQRAIEISGQKLAIDEDAKNKIYI